MDSKCKNLWDLNVPGKVNIFLWKAKNNLLAMRRNLFNKKIVEDLNALSVYNSRRQ